MVLGGWGGRGGTSLAALLLAHEVDRARVLGRARLAPSLLVVRGHAVRGLLILALLAALADDVLRARVLLRAAVAPERRARVSGVGAGGRRGRAPARLPLVRHAKVRPLLLAILAALVDDVDGALVLPRAGAAPAAQAVRGQPEVRALDLRPERGARRSAPASAASSWMPFGALRQLCKKAARGGRGAGRSPCSPCSRR